MNIFDGGSARRCKKFRQCFCKSCSVNRGAVDEFGSLCRRLNKKASLGL